MYLHSLGKHNEINLHVPTHTTGANAYHVCVGVLLDGITLREWEAVFARVVYVCVCVCVCCRYEEKAIPPHTWDKHNSGNKSGQCCLVLS